MIRQTPSAVQKALHLSFVGFSGGAMLLQIFAVAFSLSPQSNYFKNGSPLPLLAIILAAIAIGCGSANVFLSKRDPAEPQGKTSCYALLPAGVGLTISAIELFCLEKSTVATLGIIFTLLGAVYCILPLFNDPLPGTVSVFFCFAAIAGCASLTLCHYFDFTVELNAPLKLGLQIAWLLAMLFFTGDARAQLTGTSSTVYRIVAVCTITVGAMVSIPTIFAFILGKIDRIDFFAHAIAMLGITISAILRAIPRTHSSKAEDLP